MPVDQRLGFACAWTADRTRTWSGSPWALRQALARGGPVVDVGVRLPRPAELALNLAYSRPVSGRRVSGWRHAAPTRRLMRGRLLAGVRDTRPDAVVMIQDLAVLPVPFLVVQDLTYAVLLEHYGAGGVPHFPTLGRGAIERMRDRQLGLYEQAAALLPMSRWLGEHLVACGVPAGRVHPVHPGVNVPLEPLDRVPERRRGPACRLLFIGRDPHTKALDQVVAAFALLRSGGDREVTLTVAGPPAWPFAGPVPDGVDFLGPVPRERVADLLDGHDLFVMPSRLEGFGIAFAEALSRGLPCIGRRAFAMPEIIRPGTGGALVDGEDAAELAEVVARALADDELYAACAAAADGVRRYYSWERAAAEIRTVAATVSS